MLWLLLVLLLLCSGIVSGSETALFSLPRQVLHEYGQAPGRLKRRVHTLMHRPRQVLMTVLIANTAINVAIFTVSFFVLRHLSSSMTLIAPLGGLLVPLAVIVVGEVLPKAVVLANPRRFAPAAATLISVLHIAFDPPQRVLDRWLVTPFTRLFAPSGSGNDTVSTEELRLLVDHSAREGVINSTENEMLQATVALADVSIREVMTPRVDIVSIGTNTDRATADTILRSSRPGRLPVCGRDLDDIRGVLYARDFYLFPDQPIRSLVRRVHFVPEQVDLMRLLRHFRTEKLHMAVVVDEFGGTTGLVTIEDIVGWIVGDLPDADTPRTEAATERIDDNTYRVPGDLSARVWAERFGAGEVDRHIDTVGGLILARLGRVPKEGDSVRIRNLTLTVEVMRHRRIDRIILRHDAAEPPATEHAA